MRIVDIDEAALAEFGQWPWPRTIVARLVDKLTEKGAAVIAFDVVFAEPDRSSISRMVRDLVADADPETVKKLVAAIRTTIRCWPMPCQLAGGAGFGFDPGGGSQPPRRFHGRTAYAGDDATPVPAGAAAAR